MFKLRRWIYKKIVSRAKFRKWLKLEDIRLQIKEASDKQDNSKVTELICSYLSDALCSGDWESLPWEEVFYEFAYCTDLHSPKVKHKIFNNSSENKSNFKINESSWFMWSHLIAKAYGWKLEYIAQLDIDDAMGFIQEIFFEDQLEREWEWALSEKSVHYDANTKKSKFKPLDRPNWMKPEVEIKEPKVERIPIEMIPSGVIMKWDGTTDVIH